MIASKLGFRPLPPQFPTLPPANKSRPEDPRPIITTRKQPPRSCLDPIPSPPHHPRPETAAPLVFTYHIPIPAPSSPPGKCRPARVYITHPHPHPIIPARKAPPRSYPIPIPRPIIPTRKAPPHIPAPSSTPAKTHPRFPPHQPPAPIPSQTRPPRDHPHAAPPSCECRPSAFTCLPTLTRTSPPDHSSFALVPAHSPSFFLSPYPPAQFLSCISAPPPSKFLAPS
ncbi:hypothetical protein B0H14DRAFT_3440020 [Mycena olivaceomarginata]|nr:hypothetical protein B0H14DRAFT_3440020 [Mycena olivaceomarginata]